MNKRNVRAISLLSGGLDSLLAIKLLQEQGIGVTGITFESPFFSAENGKKASVELGIPLIVHDISQEIIALIKSPLHGFGKNLNPCIDCHTLMVRKAGEIAAEKGFDLIATGEVLGERPMSQNRQSLDIVANDSGFAKILLRPLSARLLEPTLPEQKGLVDRARLLAISGRSRKPQMELAAKYGITNYVQPAGGCLLTDPSFCTRLLELMHKKPDFNEKDAQLLKVGRHFRLPSGAKFIVGRDKFDNMRIAENARDEHILITSDITPGPTGLLLQSKSNRDIELATRIAASYADHNGEEVDMELKIAGEKRRVRARPTSRAEFNAIHI